jgi:hypothetical protein
MSGGSQNSDNRESDIVVDDSKKKNIRYLFKSHFSPIKTRQQRKAQAEKTEKFKGRRKYTKKKNN